MNIRSVAQGHAGNLVHAYIYIYGTCLAAGAGAAKRFRREADALKYLLLGTITHTQNRILGK